MSACAAALWRRVLAFVALAACGTTIYAATAVKETGAHARPARAGHPAAGAASAASSTYRWVFQRPDFAGAWARTLGNPSVVIAVVDTGVDPTTPSLQGALLPGYNFNDGNVVTDDPLGHGTEVASLIGARGTNVTGACSRCSILPVRVSAADGSASVVKIAAGVVWAADHGARIINISLVTNEPSQALAEAISYAQQKGALIVAAAGNDGLGVPEYPAALPGVISVEATTQTDAPYSFSNHGRSISLAAPGCAFVASRAGVSTSACGTSVAAPIVAGAAGLLAAANPAATAAQIAAALENGADRVGDTLYGRLNVQRSLQLLGGKTRFAR